MIDRMGAGGKIARGALRWLRRVAITLAIVFATIVLVRAFDARRPPHLKPWHRFVPPSEVRASDLTDSFTMEEYLRREEQVFQEVKGQIEDRLAAEDRTSGNRYFAESFSSPRRYPRDWNRTFELVPQETRGGALVIHGLTDAPYSMRKTAELLRDRGLYVLSLRMPGHGTVPGALTRVVWEDWLAAVRVGARHVHARIGPGEPFFLVGYSNGGALAVKYSLDVLEGANLPKADRIVLISPMIGVSPAAALAKFLGGLAVIPYFEKARWLDVLPEYNPFKYNSFPVNAANQTSRLTDEIHSQIERVVKAGKIRGLPPALAFQSLVDATVLTGAVVWKLYDVLEENGSELVLFDVNRTANIRPFLSPSEESLRERLTEPHKRRYALTLLANAGPETNAVVARSTPPGVETPVDRPLSLVWPPQVYSLSHVALPFPTEDPLYGGEPDVRLGGGIRLGVLAPRGERGVLTVSPGDFLRISWNPFYPYVEERVSAWIGQ
jgi:alpha-beta hydrolase superfamily lysophospholipase